MAGMLFHNVVEEPGTVRIPGIAEPAHFIVAEVAHQIRIADFGAEFGDEPAFAPFGKPRMERIRHGGSDPSAVRCQVVVISE